MKTTKKVFAISYESLRWSADDEATSPGELLLCDLE